MDNEKIKKMALQYALEKSEGDPYDPHDEEYASEVLEWLTRNHCVVLKSKILEDYEFDANCFAQFSGELAQWHKGRCDEIEELFGEELFNEE